MSSCQSVVNSQSNVQQKASLFPSLLLRSSPPFFVINVIIDIALCVFPSTFEGYLFTVQPWPRVRVVFCCGFVLIERLTRL